MPATFERLYLIDEHSVGLPASTQTKTMLEVARRSLKFRAFGFEVFFDALCSPGFERIPAAYRGRRYSSSMVIRRLCVYALFDCVRLERPLSRESLKLLAPQFLRRDGSSLDLALYHLFHRTPGGRV